MTTIEVNGTRLHYERTGDGPPMVFIHGMCGDADVWADQAARFSDRFTCVRYDRRGHSRSSWGEGIVTDALHADDAAALIEALDLAPCLLVCSSGGAAIGVEVALRHAHLLRGAVFSEPPLLSIDPEAGRELLADIVPAVERAMADQGPAAAVDAFFEAVCPGLWAIIDESRKDRYRANAEIGFTDLRSPSLQVTSEELGAIAVPALVLAGDSSHPSLRAIAQRLATALGDARLVELEDCGHVTYAEQPEAFAEAVSVFANELDERTHRIEVPSTDGSPISVWVGGAGPAAVLVHGSIADHTALDPLAEVLRLGMTTFAMDRRGFGATPDTTGFSLEQEFDDIAAVVDDAASRTGGPVLLFGHSFGGGCAMGAAARTGQVARLVLFEPSLGMPNQQGFIDAIEQALATQDRDSAVAIALRGAGMDDADIQGLRALPTWADRMASAHTIPREARVEQEWTYQPGRFEGITAPTLLIEATLSSPELRKTTADAAAAIPGAAVHLLEGHDHLAPRTDPEVVAAIIRAFSSRIS